MVIWDEHKIGSKQTRKVAIVIEEWHEVIE